MRFRCDGTTGRTAIYDTSNGDAPFTSPLSNVSLLRFHSDLWAPAVTITTASLTLPNRRPSGSAYRSSGDAQHTLFAHGKSGTPLIKGYVVIDGVNVPLSGSVPLLDSAAPTTGVGRFISIGADATNVFVLEKYVYGIAAGSPSTAVTLTFHIYVTDVILDGSGAQTQPNEAVTVSWSATQFKAGRGRINSENKYLRATSTAPEFHFPTGETITITARTTHTGYGSDRLTISPIWRYSVNGYVQEQTYGDGNTFAAQSFTAGVQGVRT